MQVTGYTNTYIPLPIVDISRIAILSAHAHLTGASRNIQSAAQYRERRHPQWTENYRLYRDTVITNRLTQRHISRGLRRHSSASSASPAQGSHSVRAR
jgi:hypothetical protein